MMGFFPVLVFFVLLKITWVSLHVKNSILGTKYPELASVRVEALKSLMTQPTISMETRLSCIADAGSADGRHVMKCIAGAMLLCGRQTVCMVSLYPVG